MPYRYLPKLPAMQNYPQALTKQCEVNKSDAGYQVIGLKTKNTK